MICFPHTGTNSHVYQYTPSVLLESLPRQ